MQIQIIAVSDVISKQSKNGKSFNEIEVTCKVDGKVQNKKLVDFSNKDTYTILAKAQKGEVYDVVTEKDSNGYWQWKAASKVEGTAAVQSDSSPVRSSSNNGSSRTGNWETAEERAARQVAIQKQNAMGVAATFLSTKAKSTEEDLFRLGKAIYAYYVGVDFEDVPQDALEASFTAGGDVE